MFDYLVLGPLAGRMDGSRSLEWVLFFCGLPVKFRRLLQSASLLLLIVVAADTMSVTAQTVLDPKIVYKALAGLQSPKSEFETTAEYQQRLATILHQEIEPGVTLQSPLPFLLNQDSVLGSSSLVARLHYDADSEYLTINISPTIIEKMSVLILKIETGDLGHYTGQNAYGATAEVSRMHAEGYGITFDRNTWLTRSDIRVSIPRDQARMIYPHLRLVLLCKAIPPYATTRFEHLDPTLDSPIDAGTNENLVAVEPIELRLYDDRTGQVFAALSEAAVVAEHRQSFPLHLEVDTNFFTQDFLYYQVDNDSGNANSGLTYKEANITDSAYNGGRPFLVVEAKSQIKIAGMDKRTLSKLVFRVNGQVVNPSWYPEKYVFLGTTFAKYSAIIRVP